MPGDLVLARVDELGKHTRLELTDGRRAHMFPGDEIVVAYGNRYAPDQYEAVIGTDLRPCDLVAAGGIASIELSRHAKMLPSTKITPLGLLGDEAGERLNLKRFAIEAKTSFPPIPVILSLGTSMNSGKTLTATSIVRGLKRHAYRVAALKITGTGAGGDMWIVRDAGADMVADFTDAGFASTYLVSTPELESATYRLLNHVAAAGCDIAVVEIADGLQQVETAALIRSDAIQAVTLGTMFASYDSMGAICGVDTLRHTGHYLLGLSGRLGLSPLGVREAETATGLRLYSPWELQQGVLVPAIRRRAAEQYAASGGTLYHLRAIEMSASSRERWHAIGAGDATAEKTKGNRPNAPNIAASSPAQLLLGMVAKHVMASEVSEKFGPGLGDPNSGRRNRRNGFRQITWPNPAGPIKLFVPRLRRGSYVPSFLANSNQPSLPGAIDSAIGSLGTPKIEEALRRLVETVSGQPAQRSTLQKLVSEVSEFPNLSPTGSAQKQPHGAQIVAGMDADAAYGNMEEESAIAFANSFRVERLPVMRATDVSDPADGPTFDIHLMQAKD